MDNFGFLFKKSSLPKSDLDFLLSVEGFLSAAKAVIDEGKGIEDNDIYNIVKSLYFPKLKSNERSSVALRLSKAVRRFSKVLFNDENAWKSDYEKYLQDC
ncbi:MAG: hypothetical protein IKI94_08860 [Ruminococcus sp.]|nr:hypothetical protein [Ruminococcus sp.]